MTEDEYINATDLAKLRTVAAILHDCMCMEDPNKTRLRSVRQNISLMTDDLHERIKPFDVEDNDKKS